MGYQLLWIEALAFNLLLAALVTACSARLARRRWQILWPALIVGLDLLNVVGGLVAYYAIVTHRFAFGWSGYFISLQLLSLGGTAYLVWRGLRANESDERAPVARHWPRARLGVATVIALGLSFMTFQDLDATMKAEATALRAEAGALAVSVAPQPVPDADNAAVVYEKAFEALPEHSASDQLHKWLEAPEKFAGTAAFDYYLGRHRNAIRFFLLASAKPSCSFDRNYAQPSVAMLLPEVQKLRHGARLLMMDARVRAGKGDLTGASRNIAALRSMAGHVRSEPLLISLMVAVAIETMADRTLEHCLSVKTPVPGSALDAVGPSGAVLLRRDLARTLRMEEAMGLSAFADLSLGTLSLDSLAEMGADQLGNDATPAAWRVFFLRSELDSYRRELGRAQELASYPYRKSRERWTKLQPSREEPMGIIVALLLPATRTMAEKTARGEARARLADLGVAVTRYRLKHGRYPAKLEDLLAEAPPLLAVDPFDGQPLRMTAADGGLVLYSVGPDGVDDGGREFDRKNRTGDITFCLGAAYEARRGASR